jgi:hypothetical protein
VIDVKQNLDVLRDGLQQLGVYDAELTPEAIAMLNQAARTRDHELSQLQPMAALAGLEDDAALITQHLSAERSWREASRLAPAVDRIRVRYQEVRRSVLNKENIEAEAAKDRVKIRPGFAQLDRDQARRVLRPITSVLVNTTDEAISPTLIELRDHFASRIHSAEDQANDRLDEELSKQAGSLVVKVETQLRGREVAGRAELQAVLKELEERIGPLLDQGARVRIV